MLRECSPPHHVSHVTCQVNEEEKNIKIVLSKESSHHWKILPLYLVSGGYLPHLDYLSSSVCFLSISIYLVVFCLQLEPGDKTIQNTIEQKYRFSS